MERRARYVGLARCSFNQCVPSSRRSASLTGHTLVGMPFARCRGDHLVDGVAGEPGRMSAIVFSVPLMYSMTIGYSMKRRDPATHARAAFRLFREEPRERAVVGAKDEWSTEQIDAKVLSAATTTARHSRSNV